MIVENSLSKSTFIRGLQCEKSLYLYKHHHNLKDPTRSSLKVFFNQGTNIGILAQELFPDGGVFPLKNAFFRYLTRGLRVERKIFPEK